MSRGKEQNDFWWKKFKHPDVIAVFKGRLFELFDNRCFRCGSTDNLQIDHNIPHSHGGKLEAGNLVILCRKCNGSKGNIAPDIFYGERLFVRLQHLLDKENAIFDFKWDWAEFNLDRKRYLLNLGIGVETVERIFGDPDYRGYMPLREQVGISLTVERLS